jgi:hypothetical protein
MQYKIDELLLFAVPAVILVVVLLVGYLVA